MEDNVAENANEPKILDLNAWYLASPDGAVEALLNALAKSASDEKPLPDPAKHAKNTDPIQLQLVKKQKWYSMSQNVAQNTGKAELFLILFLYACQGFPTKAQQYFSISIRKSWPLILKMCAARLISMSWK